MLRFTTLLPAAFLMLSTAVQAVTVIDSNGFESNTAGNLLTQTATTVNGLEPWLTDFRGADVEVQTVTFNSGSQAVQMTKQTDGTLNPEFAGVSLSTPYDPMSQVVTLSWDMYLPAPAGDPQTNPNGPFYGMQASDDDSSMGNPFLLGFMGVDSLTGEIRYIDPFSVSEIDDGSGGTLAAPFDVWNTFAIEYDFGTDTQTLFFNTTPVQSLRFTDSDPSQFNTINANLNLFSSVEMAVYPPTGGASTYPVGTAFFDNVVVSAVPEPSAFLGLGFLCMLAGLRRYQEHLPRLNWSQFMMRWSSLLLALLILSLTVSDARAERKRRSVFNPFSIRAQQQSTRRPISFVAFLQWRARFGGESRSSHTAQTQVTSSSKPSTTDVSSGVVASRERLTVAAVSDPPLVSPGTIVPVSTGRPPLRSNFRPPLRGGFLP